MVSVIVKQELKMRHLSDVAYRLRDLAIRVTLETKNDSFSISWMNNYIV